MAHLLTRQRLLTENAGGKTASRRQAAVILTQHSRNSGESRSGSQRPWEGSVVFKGGTEQQGNCSGCTLCKSQSCGSHHDLCGWVYLELRSIGDFVIYPAISTRGGRVKAGSGRAAYHISELRKSFQKIPARLKRGCQAAGHESVI